MYKDYFAFSEPPFSIAPDPRYLYMSSRHREALAHLLYGVESDGGFVLLTGDVGTGKTTVCRCLLETLPAHCDVAYIYNPKLTVQELLATICEEFGIPHRDRDRSNKRLVDQINAFLLDSHARGRKALLIIDEAQNLSVDVLEQLRLLTNLETNQRKLLQIILLGQPELLEMLAGRELRQLAQRIIARYHLHPLSKAEAAAYVNHRLTVAGSGRRLFSPSVLRRIHRLSKGVPRVINLLCDRALLGGYVQGKDQVDHRILTKAAREVLGQKKSKTRFARIAVRALVAAALGFSVTLALVWREQSNQASVAAPNTEEFTPVEPTPVVASPVVSSELTWPEAFSKGDSESMAMATLFDLWGMKIQGNEPLCQQALTYRLSCLSDRGRLEDLRKLNLPVILELEDLVGGKFFAALKSLNERTAMLVLGDGVVKEVSSSILEKRWTGAFTLLWRVPPDYKGPLRVGAQGEPVTWLSQQLAKVAGYDLDSPEKFRFDPALERQVRNFQAMEGLQPDGNVGPLTLIRLAMRTDDNVPKLDKGR